MTPAEEARHLDAQHPNRWIDGTWYPATASNGKRIEIKRTQGRGANRNQYLHIRWMQKHVLKAPDGERLREWQEYDYARIMRNDPAAQWVNL